MIRRNTWILLIILVLLVGAAFYFNNQKKTSAGATPTPANTFLFSSKDGQPTDIKIEDTAGHSVEIARNSTGSWVLKAPTADAANQSQAESAATQLTSLNMLGNVQIGLDVVGLTQPTYTMTVTFDSAKTHKVLIGSVNPIQTGYYVQVDGGPVQVADKSGIDSLVGMLTAPPYLSTLTPTITLTPIPSDTPTAVPQATNSPAATLGAATTTILVTSAPVSITSTP
ncbi:MAG: DUF4340 domain-containing protein [Anaerolineales bacterium]